MSAIKSIGDNVVETILEARRTGGPFRDLRDFIERVSNKEANKRTIESFIDSGAFDSFGYNRHQMKEVYPKIIDEVTQEKKKATSGQISLLDFMGAEDKKAFGGVKEAFEAVRSFADIAIVSAANRGAVEEEWERFGLLPLVDVMMCQDVGSKEHCIAVMLEKGYEKDHVLMCGDAPGDRAAAEKNGVYYYPILVRHETESWAEFPEAAKLLAEGRYAPYGERKAKEFIDNLTK